LKNIRSILLLASILALSVALSVDAFSDESYNKRSVFDQMGAKEFSRKHCDRSCISVILGTYYAIHSMNCKVTRVAFEKNPSRYQWLNTIGRWNINEFKFAARTSSFINWQASKVIVAVSNLPNDYTQLDKVVRAVIKESIKEVYAQCTAVNGTFKI
jgi:hypothetical protein